MFSVTQRAGRRVVWQPYGGILPLNSFTKTLLGAGESEMLEGNFDGKRFGGITGMVVDYLTRYFTGTPAECAFSISLKGAKILESDPYYSKSSPMETAYTLLEKINELDTETIISACKLVGFDVVFRAGEDYFLPVEEIKPDEASIHNIRLMIERTLVFPAIWPHYIKRPNIFGWLLCNCEQWRR